MDSQYDVVIIGAGLSGLSCGIALVDKGCRVLILEARPVIGGRTSSWEENGMAVESGLHRFLGFFEALPNLLQHVGLEINDVVAWEDEIEIRLPDNQPSAVFGLSLFKPIETFAGLLSQNDFLSPSEKIAIGKFFTEGFSLFKSNPLQLDRYTVKQYAQRLEVSDRAIHRLLVPLTEGLFFLPIEQYSALNFFALFAPYLPKLQRSRAGAFRGGMTEIMMQPMAEYIKERGGIIQTECSASQLVIQDGRVASLVADRKSLTANHVVIATSLSAAQTLLREPLSNHPWFSTWLSMPSMPAVTAQFNLSQPALEVDRTTFSPGTVLSSYAEQSRTTFPGTGRLSAILANPDQYLKAGPKQIFQEIMHDAKRLNLNMRQETVRDFRIIRWLADFYAYTHGTYELRPDPKTPIHGLTLAGDYTRQEYLSTMEGAVVSGNRAAEIVLTSD